MFKYIQISARIQQEGIKDKKYKFSSFSDCDSTYKIMFKLWKNSSGDYENLETEEQDDDDCKSVNLEQEIEDENENKSVNLKKSHMTTIDST